MALPGETGWDGKVCNYCGTHLHNEVLRSGAGWYIGTRCECGPFSRESGYYRTELEAKLALASGMFGR